MLGLILGPLLALIMVNGGRQPDRPAPAPSLATAEITSVSISKTQVKAGEKLDLTLTAIASRRMPQAAMCVLFMEKGGGNFWLCKPSVVVKHREESIYYFTLTVPESAPPGSYIGTIQISDNRGNLIGEADNVATVEVVP